MGHPNRDFIEVEHSNPEVDGDAEVLAVPGDADFAADVESDCFGGDLFQRRVSRSGDRSFTDMVGAHQALTLGGHHRPLDDFLQRRQVFAAEIDSHGIAGMLVHGDAQTRLQFDRQHIASLLDAQFSLPYTLAVAAESGCATIDQFQPLRTREPEIARLMAATQVLILHLRDRGSTAPSLARPPMSEPARTRSP